MPIDRFARASPVRGGPFAASARRHAPMAGGPPPPAPSGRPPLPLPPRRGRSKSRKNSGSRALDSIGGAAVLVAHRTGVCATDRRHSMQLDICTYERRLKYRAHISFVLVLAFARHRAFARKFENQHRYSDCNHEGNSCCDAYHSNIDNAVGRVVVVHMHCCSVRVARQRQRRRQWQKSQRICRRCWIFRKRRWWRRKRHGWWKRWEWWYRRSRRRPWRWPWLQ